MPTKAKYTLTTPSEFNIKEQDQSFEFVCRFEIDNIWKIWGDNQKVYNRKWVMIIKRDDYNLLSFKTPYDPQTKNISTPSDKKEGFSDVFSQILLIKNPYIIGLDSSFILRIEARDKDDASKPFLPTKKAEPEFYEIKISIKTLYKTIDDFIINPIPTPNILSFQNVADEDKTFKLDILASTKNFVSNSYIINNTLIPFSPIIELEIKSDFASIVSFPDNGTNKISLFTAFLTNIINKETDLSTSVNIKIKNPKKFGYSEDIILLYRIYSRYFNTQTLVHEQELPITVTTLFEQFPETNTGFINTGRELILFNGANDRENKQYDISFNLQNSNSLVNDESDYEISVKIIDDTDNLISIIDTDSKSIMLDIQDTYSIACDVVSPKTFDYDKQIKIQVILNKIENNSSRTKILQEEFPLTITNKNVQINDQIVASLNVNSIVFSNIHEFRRTVNFIFSTSGITFTDNHKIKIDIYNDKDNLFSVFDDDTKGMEFIAESSLTIPMIITNPTILHYDEDIQLQFLILETTPESNSVLTIYKKVFPINVLTTYNTVKRAIFNGEYDVNISGLELEQKPVGPEIENEIFINTEIFQPVVKITGTDILFDSSVTDNKTINIKLSITGLSIGSVEIRISETSDLVFFENGLKSIKYDIESNTENVIDAEIPVLVINPFKENFNENIQLMYIVSDLIDEYSQVFYLNIKTSYTITDLQNYFTSKVNTFSSQLKQLTDKLSTDIVDQYNQISLISQDQFQQLNSSILSLDFNELSNSLKLKEQFLALENSLTLMKHINTNIQYLQNYDVTKDDIIVYVYDVSNDVETQLNSTDYEYADKQFTIGKMLEKGRYILKLQQKETLIQDINILTTSVIGNFTLITTSALLNFDLTNTILKTLDNKEYLVISNSPQSLLILGEANIENEPGKIIKNLFIEESYILNITFYDIDDVSAVFLNKKITQKLDSKSKSEIVYDTNNQDILFKLKYITDSANKETRTKE